MIKYVDGERVEMTPEEIAEFEATRNPVVPPSMEDYQRAIEIHLDQVVAQKGYSSILSAASYDGDPIYGAEGAAAKLWRSQVWVYVYQELAKVQQGQRTQPTIEELIAELPTIQWS